LDRLDTLLAVIFVVVGFIGAVWFVHTSYPKLCTRINNNATVKTRFGEWGTAGLCNLLGLAYVAGALLALALSVHIVCGPDPAKPEMRISYIFTTPTITDRIAGPWENTKLPWSIYLSKLSDTRSGVIWMSRDGTQKRGTYAIRPEGIITVQMGGGEYGTKIRIDGGELRITDPNGDSSTFRRPWSWLVRTWSSPHTSAHRTPTPGRAEAAT
jgi:hypothetical protein